MHPFTDASRLRAHLRRTAILLVQITLLTVSLSSAPNAHEGHDHSETVLTPMTASPRLALESELFQIVGIVGGTSLSIYLD